MPQFRASRARQASIVAGALMLASVGPAPAQQEPAVQRGLTFVRVHCAQCHSIDTVSESPLKIAPPFDGFYYVEKAVHTYSPNGLRTHVLARRPGMPFPPYGET